MSGKQHRFYYVFGRRLVGFEQRCVVTPAHKALGNRRWRHVWQCHDIGLLATCIIYILYSIDMWVSTNDSIYSWIAMTKAGSMVE